ncbi:MAG: GNAT family N-acetyltransferase [Anaerolineales bacterium]
MSAQAISIQRELPANLRPFDIRRDLSTVADLVELCFANSLDADGRLYIRQMRQAARSGPLLDLAATGSRADLPLGGFVWQEDGRVVGNLSLLPHQYGSQRLFLIANVAVHPDHRRRGIARALTQAALADVERRGPRDTWLQVDQDNPAAVKLYAEMGFVEKMRRTSWRMHPQPDLSPQRISTVKVLKTHRADWSAQRKWLDATYPTNLRWHLPLEPQLLQPGWRGALERALSSRQVEQWSAIKNRKLLGVLSWQSSTLESDRLWLAVDAKREEEAIVALMRQAHNSLRPERNLALNFPSGRASKALLNAGFNAARTLIWMEYPW